ncbi:hypothetical protein [Chondromyces crocatus]|nr:hypothetical protein [Chondromyces crocatus]
MADEETSDDAGLRFLRAVEVMVILPDEARTTAARWLDQSRARHPEDALDQHQDRAARDLVGYYASLAATSGGLTSLAGIVPGLGTAVAMLGGGVADGAICMKLQVDMCLCLAGVFGWDLDTEEARYLSFLLSAGATLERAGDDDGERLDTEGGVARVRRMLKGARLQSTSDLFKKVGIVLARSSIAKSLPFGIGVVFSGGTNYALMKYVGEAATCWLRLDRATTDPAA